MSTGAGGLGESFGSDPPQSLFCRSCDFSPTCFLPSRPAAGDLPAMASERGSVAGGAVHLLYPSALAPERHPTHTKLVVLSRWLSAVFWFVLWRHPPRWES